MLSDTMFQKTMDFATGANTHYYQVPYRCTLADVRGIVQADPGDDQTITVSGGATVSTTTTTLGVLTFGSSIAPGAVGEWAADATTGKTILEAGHFIKLVTSAGAAAQCDLSIELNPYAN